MANIFVGVGIDYEHTSIELKGCSVDIGDIAKALQENFKISILSDSKNLQIPLSGSPLKRVILSSWKNAIVSAQPGDKVILYYSGHATLFTDESNNTFDCIVPLDAASSIRDITLNQLITSYDLYELFIQTPMNVELLFVADSCFCENITELQTQVKGVTLKQVEPFKHLKTLLEAVPQNLENAHGKITLLASCKSLENLSTKSALTAALSSLITLNSVMTILANCWTSNGLSKLKEALIDTINEKKLSDELQIFFVDSSSGVPLSPPIPSSPFFPIQPLSWEEIWNNLKPAYYIENGGENPNKEPGFSEINLWLLMKYRKYKEANKYPLELLNQPPSTLDPALFEEPFNVDRLIGNEQSKSKTPLPITVAFDNLGRSTTKKTKRDKDDKNKMEKRKKIGRKNFL